MKIVEIFDSIEGEGKRAGQLATFIRVHGCNLRCSYCDSKYSYESGASEMSVKEILKKVTYDKITLTGGEPLMHANVVDLLIALISAGKEVNIETNGSVSLHKVPSDPLIFTTMDYKCPSSGMEKEMDLYNLKLLEEKDVLKFVVGGKRDLDRALEVLTEHQPKAQVYFSPIYGKIKPADIVAFLKEHDLRDAKVQLQLHKIIWKPTTTGV